MSPLIGYYKTMSAKISVLILEILPKMEIYYSQAIVTRFITMSKRSSLFSKKLFFKI